MSLILLFLPHNNVPPIPGNALAPAVMHSVELIRPVLYSVQEATGTFTTSTVTYSSSTVAYSSVIETYGGSDASKITPGGILYSIDQATPTIYSIEKI